MRKIVALAAALGLLLGLVGGGGIAMATVELKPTSVDFHTVLVGSGPAEKHSFLLYAGCAEPGDPPLCKTRDSVTTNPSTTGDFVLVNNYCPAVLEGPEHAGVQPEFCLMVVGFSPTAVGLRTGTLVAGGLTSTLTGTGIVPSELFPKIPTTPPTAKPPTPPTPPTVPGPKAKKNKGKKCGAKKGKGKKKGHKAKGSAAASKKAKKGKKGCGKKK